MTNQELERHYFGLFQNVFPLPPSDITFGDKPDVRVSGERKIGIEITNLYLQSGSDIGSEQSQRPLRAKAISMAHRLYQRSGGHRFELTFGFKDGAPITDVRRVAQQLCDLAKGLQYATSGPLPPDAFGTIPELSFVYLNAKEFDDATWRNSEAHGVGLMSTDTLRTVIQQKERKCAGYDSCDAYWLLIVVDFMDRAQEQEIRLNHLPSFRSNVFERIFVFTTFGHYVEVGPPSVPTSAQRAIV